ncbi:MAG: hypothetical protein ACK5E4_14435 [Planctomycetia bacterium]|jgi:hypothetical protein
MKISIFGTKILFLIVLILSGTLAGYQLASKKHHLSLTNEERHSIKNFPKHTSFPLSNFDIKENIEKPSITVDDSGKIFVIWASQTSSSEKKLFLAVSENNGESFKPPREIAHSEIFKSISELKGKTIAREIRMTPHLAHENGSLFLGWTESLPGNSGVRMIVTTSDDAGKSFRKPLVVHQGEKARATFTSLSVGKDKTIACSWLDNREKVQIPYVSIKFPNQENFSPEEGIIAGQLDKGVCPCCPTACLIDCKGTVFVAFRNIVDGYRDFWIAKKTIDQPRFDKPVPVIPPTWKFNGCPHDGASMLIQDDKLHIVWMDARNGSQRCYHAWANTADLKFTSSELNSIAQGSQGNAKIIADSNGNIYAAWEETKENTVPQGDNHKNHDNPFKPGLSRNIMLATFSKSNMKFSKAIPLINKPDVFQTRPSVAVSKSGQVFVCWNELSEIGKSIVITSFKNNALLVNGEKE